MRILLFLGILLGAAWHGVAAPRPNIIFILTDDQGYGDISAHGNPVLQTPHLDRLRGESVRFTNFFVSPTCAPTRSALLTGRHEFRNGVTHTILERERLVLSAMTLPQVLQTAGYATGIFGKWHLGDARQFLPFNQGFDEYLGLPYSNDMWPVGQDGAPVKKGAFKSQYPPLPLIQNDRPIDTINTLEDQATLTGRLADAAIQFIRKNKNKPFFLLITNI